jgi:hypothetical protein
MAFKHVTMWDGAPALADDMSPHVRALSFLLDHAIQQQERDGVPRGTRCPCAECGRNRETLRGVIVESPGRPPSVWGGPLAAADMPAWRRFVEAWWTQFQNRPVRTTQLLPIARACAPVLVEHGGSAVGLNRDVVHLARLRAVLAEPGVTPGRQILKVEVPGEVHWRLAPLRTAVLPDDDDGA